MHKPNHIAKDFIVLSPDKKATIETADADLYPRIARNYDGFKGHELIAGYEFETDWSSWEVHPKGDEIVMLMAGEIEFILRTDSGEQSIELKEPGEYLVVPKGVWHTAKTKGTAKVLFITPGEGTQHEGI